MFLKGEVGRKEVYLCVAEANSEQANEEGTPR
jgi:hypothetical protein